MQLDPKNRRALLGPFLSAFWKGHETMKIYALANELNLDRSNAGTITVPFLPVTCPYIPFAPKTATLSSATGAIHRSTTFSVSAITCTT